MRQTPTVAKMAAASQRIKEMVAEYTAWKPEKWTKPRKHAIYQIGDVLQVTCPQASTQVVGVSPYHVSTAWPWGKIDPDSRYHWNGQAAFPIDPDNEEWQWSLFRLKPKPDQLAVCDSCMVLIPKTYVVVLDIISHDPPEDTGKLPRPHTTLVVRKLDDLEPLFGDDDEEDSGIGIELGGAEPVELEVVYRED